MNIVIFIMNIIITLDEYYNTHDEYIITLDEYCNIHQEYYNNS